MKPITRISIFLGVALIGIGVGFITRGLVGGSDAPAQMSASGVKVQDAKMHSTDNATWPPGMVNDDSPLVSKLEQGLSTTTGVTWWLHWFEALEKAKLPDFPKLRRLAQRNVAAQRLLALHWMELDPNDLLRNVPPAESGKVEELARVLFQEWPKRDPEAVIAALNKPENLAHREYWEGHVLEGVLEVNVERGLRLLHEWNIDNFSPRMHAVAKWAAKDPQYAAEYAIKYPAGHGSELAMETIGKEWARTDPRAAVAFGVEQGGMAGLKLAAATLKVWSESNRPEAAAWLAEVDPRMRNQMSPAFVEGWGRKDPAAALEWCEEHLSGSTMAQAVGAMMQGAVGRDVAEAAKLVAGMHPSAARAEAARAVAPKWLPSWLRKDAKADPEALAWLRSLDSESVARALEQVQSWWASSDPKTLSEFLGGYQDGNLPTHVYGGLVRQMVGENPAKAMEWAEQLPENKRLSVGAHAFGWWRYAQTDSAMKWLNELPPTDPRRKPFFMTAVEDLAYDPRAANHFAAMSEADRLDARAIIASAPIPEERRVGLLKALEGKLQ